MVTKYISPGFDHCAKILHGNDTDVSLITIIQLHKDKYSVTMIDTDDETGKAHSQSCDWDLAELTKNFELQYGAPMQYMSKENFEWITQ